MAIVNFLYFCVFFIVIVVNIWISLFIRLNNVCFLRNTLRKILRVAIDRNKTPFASMKLKPIFLEQSCSCIRKQQSFQRLIQMNSNVGLTFFLKSLDQSFCFLNKNAFRLHAYCTFCVWCLNNETHGIVHINKDKRVLNEDKCTVFCVSCHEVILQNYFRCNLSCHVMFVLGPMF